MAVTQNTYTGNASTTNFAFTFPYLKKADVKVKLDGTTQPTTEYTWFNATTIQMNTAPATGVVVLIYRDTSNDSKAGTVYAGSMIKAEDLNHHGYVFSGHFHRRQVKGNIHYIGNTFPHNYSDANDFNHNNDAQLDHFWCGNIMEWL